MLRKLDRFDAVILDDIGYVQQDRDEMEVLFTFLAERYERRSVMITSNLVLSQWDRIFKDPMTTACAIDRLVHHSVILELTGTSYRTEAAKKRNAEIDGSERPGRPEPRQAHDHPEAACGKRPPLPSGPHLPGRAPDGLWKAGLRPPSHSPWKTPAGFPTGALLRRRSISSSSCTILIVVTAQRCT